MACISVIFIVDVRLTSANLALLVLGVILLCVAIAGCVIIVLIEVRSDKGTIISNIIMYMYYVCTLYVLYILLYHDFCTLLHACVYNVHTSITTAVLPYMHVCTMYILLYHDFCTLLHACVYNVHTSITTAVLPYMHVCTMYILLSQLLYSPTCMCVQCTYFYHNCCTPLHACVYNVHVAVTGRKRTLFQLIQLFISLECFIEITPDFLCPVMND